MAGERIMWALCLWAAGFVSAVIVGARNGEQMAAGVADVLDTCDEMARADRADCLARVDVMASAVQPLGEWCVLSVPPAATDEIRKATCSACTGPINADGRCRDISCPNSGS